MDDTPACWEKYNTKSSQCESCPFAAACRLCSQTAASINRPVGGQNYDAVAAWASDLADYSHIPGESKHPSRNENTRAALAKLLRFLLRIDDYTLGIVAELLNNEQHYSVADLARIRGISRQGMHRKLLDATRKHPELAALFAMTVKKIRRARNNFPPPRQTQTGNH